MRTLVYRKSRRQRGREPERHKLHVAKGDTVRVIRGEHRGKEGKILRVHPKQFRIVVEGVNVVKKHKRATGAPGSESGIIEFPAPIAASNVKLPDPKSGDAKHRRTRRGKEGKILRVHPKQFRIGVEGVNVVKKHKRATGAPGSESGIIEFPAPIAASNVMLLDPKSGEPTRVRRRRDKDGTVERIAIKSGQPIPRVT